MWQNLQTVSERGEKHTFVLSLPDYPLIRPCPSPLPDSLQLSVIHTFISLAYVFPCGKTSVVPDLWRVFSFF